MEVDTKLLDILFRKMSPSQLLDRLGSWKPTVDLKLDRFMFRRSAPQDLSGYSLDEHDLIFNYLHEGAASFDQHQLRAFSGHGRVIDEDSTLKYTRPLPDLAIFSVLSFASEVLKQENGIPVCRIEKAYTWRDTFLLLGQDLFVCAYLAAEDLRNRRERRDFTWPAVIRTDLPELNRILQEGVAENHQHLYGSSQTFALNWCSLMNYPESHQKIEEYFGELYQPAVIFQDGEKLVSTKDRVRYAAICRKHLFRKLHNLNRDGEWDWLYELCPEIRANAEIAELREIYGARIPQHKGEPKVLDYALEEEIFIAAPDVAYRSLAGERWFLYSCFRKFLLNELNEKEKLLLYLYLVLKSLFRSELIQVNRYVGFHNFANYQNRKTKLCDTPFYNAELLRMALNAPIREGHVTSLETRVGPGMTVDYNFESVTEPDEMFRFGDLSLEELQDPTRPPLPPITQTNLSDNGLFYVIHFIKEIETPAHMLKDLELTCRNNRVRKRSRQQALCIAECLSNSEYYCRRIRGIDAANHEFGTPPEAFAPVFRFLHNFRVSDFARETLLKKEPVHRLSTTYHAGEDFLDIAGALRTIDEAVTFLEMQRGDRIGHALGLGVAPEIHYQLKGHRIFLRRQDRLDDLIWILFRGNELGVSIENRSDLEKEARDLLEIIYGDAIRENEWNITLQDYYDSMLLRADSPDRYITMKYEPYNGLGDLFEEFAVSLREQRLERIRTNHKFAGMYYYYHYGKRERTRGEKTIDVQIDDQYICLMRKLQDALQWELAAKGISIESNPSSNVLIGTFGMYEKHPVFRFNNTDLEIDHRKYKECPQLTVSINTDDLGVFDTSQEFEYALLYVALNNITDEQGDPRYGKTEILRYLENLRKMGHAVVFPPC